MIPAEGNRVAIAYGHRSLDLLSLRSAARGWCEIVWLVDGSDPSVIATMPLLRRSGAVVDAGGLTPAQAAAALAEHAPQGLATFYDTDMERLALIAAELGLPFHRPEVARALEDKLHQREALRAAGLPTPTVLALPAGLEPAAALERAARFPFPAVLKPRRASGSFHTFVVEDHAALGTVLASLADEPLEERILEQYLSDGPRLLDGFAANYVSVESLVVAGRPIHLATTGRFPLVVPMRETGFFIPSTLSPPQTATVLETATAALTGLGVHTGAMHTEIKLTSEGPRVIEINGRIGGGVPDMLRLTTGLDLIGLSLRAALGHAAEVPEMPATDGVAYRFFYQPPPGVRRLAGLQGLEALGAQPGVESVVVHWPIGHELDSRHGTRTYLFAVVGRAGDHAGVVAMDRYLQSEIVARYD